MRGARAVRAAVRASVRAAAVLAAGAAGAGCELKRPPSAADSAAARAAQAEWDSLARVTAPGAQRDAATGDGAARVAGGEVAPAAGPAPLPATLDSVDAPDAPDTTAAPRPTAEELAALARELAIPVQGVQPAQLVDSFDEARGGTRRHDAIDILAPRGTPVLAATGGRLLRLYQSKNGGLMVYASDPSERFVLMYAHLDRYADGLTEGMALQRGQRLGDVGTTGNAPANTPHLHFAITRAANVRDWWKGTPVNPRPLLAPAPGVAPAP